MNYKVKQQNAKLETWYICHKLGIKYSEWVDVRNNRRNLSSDKLDIFNELTYKNANEWINQADEKHKIDEWYENHTSESLKEKIREFGTNQLQIAKELGCDASIVCNVVKYPEKNSQIKYLLYYYLTDEFNKRTGVRVANNGRIIKEDNDDIVEDVEHNDEMVINSNETTEEFINSIDEALKLRNKENSIETPISSDTLKQTNINVDKQDQIIGVSFVKKEDYDKVVAELGEVKKDLNRYKYLIDLLMNK